MEEEIDTSERDYAIFIKIADPQRAIWFDPEADTCEANATYTNVLKRLAALSGGALVITHVVEDWHRRQAATERHWVDGSRK